MKLSALLANVAVTGDLGKDPEVFGVRHDSRTVEPGELFVTWSGAKFDGRLFAGQAAERGAVAIIADRDRPADAIGDIPWLRATDPRAILGDLAAPAYGHPDRDLKLIGVTGTNGKSTVVELCAAILEAAGFPCGRIGTLGYRFAGDDLGGVSNGRTTERTTPEASDFFRLLAAMRDRGARAVAIEVSSHALVQGRVKGASFDAALFTNLTRDHLDFHGDLETYFGAKRQLFDLLKPGGVGVVNVDDSYGRRIASELTIEWTFGSTGSGAAIRPAGVELDGEGIRGNIATPGGAIPFRSSLLGRYNLSNLLAAAAAALALGLPPEAVTQGFARTRPLAGRMEAVRAGQSFLAVVDYAHTDAALGAAIRSLRELTGTKVAVVFGCGGDRDPGKRPVMGKVAGDLADLPIATSDNPRSEDPLAILAAVEEGLKASANRNYRIVPDRREAIRRAVGVATAGGWSVLVAGKGHESEQIVGTQRIPFSDRAELEIAIGERIGSEARS
ncbi:MAG: UDP-N-acetylmuramoyl-L-alanyl-D-glutamate--2,6-diaminopimelate ligase [Thermoanaerobaculia bacterium]